MIISVCCFSGAKATKYYFSILSGEDWRTSTQAQNPATPWKTLSKLNSFFSSLKPGDVVLFKRGETFTGKVNITKSGTSTAPITISAYGSGNAPVFKYDVANAATIPIRKRVILYAAAGISNITIDGINLTDPTMSASTIHTATTANVGYAIDFDGSTTTGCNGISLKNLDISLVGNAIEIKGNNNIVTKCSIYDLGGVVNVSGSAGENNYGANAVTVAGSNNTISYNYFKNLWRTDLYFNYDGGAIEMYGAVGGKTSNNNILYNTVINCNGFMEMGSGNSSDSANYNVFAYNLLINNGGRIATLHNGGDRFSEHITNLKLYNNNIVETVHQYDDATSMLWSSSSATNSLIIMRNNIFWLQTNVSIAKKGYFTGSQLIHTNNIYHLSGGSLNFTLGSKELNLATATAVFSNTANSNPALWDYSPGTRSPAIDYGINIGSKKDFRGTLFSTLKRNAGIYELSNHR